MRKGRLGSHPPRDQIQHRKNADDVTKNLSELRTDSSTDLTYLLLGNAAKLASSTHRKIQILVAWPDPALQITVHTGSLASAGGVKYLSIAMVR
jgi:hypothetical protein